MSVVCLSGLHAFCCLRLCLQQYPGLFEAGFPMQAYPSRSRGGLPPLGLGADAFAGMIPPGRGPDSPRRSGSNASQLFDALVMAATGGTEGAAAAPAANDAPAVDSRALGGPQVSPSGGAAPLLPVLPGVAGGVTPVAAASAAAAAAAAATAAAATAATAAASRGTSGAAAALHGQPHRQRSRLWSALSYGDVDSLQNALDAFRVGLVGVWGMVALPAMSELKFCLSAAVGLARPVSM